MGVIDTALVEELRDVMDDEFVELVNAFESDTRHRFCLLEQAIAVEDSESLRTTAHSMKGGAMGMGAVGLSRRFRGLELRGRECSRSEEGRVGKGCCGTGRARGAAAG